LIEFSLGGPHLAEMTLASESGKLPEKDQKGTVLELVSQCYSLAVIKVKEL
jgi:hypothetical protein